LPAHEERPLRRLTGGEHTADLVTVIQVVAAQLRGVAAADPDESGSARDGQLVAGITGREHSAAVTPREARSSKRHRLSIGM